MTRLPVRETEAGRVRLEELEFLLSCGTPAADAIRRLGFPSADSAETFLRRRGRHELARVVALEAGEGDPYQEVWDRAFLLTHHGSIPDTRRERRKK